MTGKDQTVGGGLIPSVESSLPFVDDDVYDRLATGSTRLGRLQLYSKGEYGIPGSGESIQNLGKSCDCLILARRPKALDVSNTDEILPCFDLNSKEFIRVAKASSATDSGCMFGVSFLVFERTSKRFLEYYAGTRSARERCKTLYRFLPKFHTKVLPPVTFTSCLIEEDGYAWHTSEFNECPRSLDMPSEDELSIELWRFFNPDPLSSW